MSDDLLAQLTEAKTEEESWKIIIQSYFQTLPEKLSKAVWTIAVPHWFNESILRALFPDSKNDLREIYQQLVKLPFVQDFPERGHNIFQSNRQAILRNLWKENRKKFINISTLAKEYFKQYREKKTEAQIEYLYHLVVVNSEQGAKEIREICAEWNNKFCFAELEYLVNSLLEQVEENRVQGLAKAVIFYRQARAALRLDQPSEVLKEILQNLYIAEEILHKYRDKNLQADILQTIGDTLISLNKYQEAREKYHQSLELYKEQDDSLNIANVLQSLGTVYCKLQICRESLGYYESALNLFYKIDDVLGQANTLSAIMDVLKNYNLFDDKSCELSEKIHSHVSRSSIYTKVVGHRVKYYAPKRLYLLFQEKATKLYSDLGYTFINTTIQDRTEKINKEKPSSKGRNPIIHFSKTSTIIPREIPDLIKYPIVTEKATILLENNKYVFTVKPSAIKPDIKKAIETLFDVKVIKVNTQHLPKKKTRRGNFIGYKSHYKKAIVTLAEGDKIPLFPEV